VPAFDQIHAVADILREAARTEIMPRFRNLGDNGVRQKKSAIDVVTEADEAAERRITAALREAFPGAVIVGEEAASADASVMTGLGEADLAFVIDPVDGTLNYASDLPLFAVMAAALRKGEPVAALILDPNLDDCAMALKGEGAWLEDAAGRRRDLRVASGAPLADMTAMVSWKYFDEPHRSRIPAAFPRFADVSSLRCCGQEYRLGAAGAVHVQMYGRLNPWDHAPGALIYAEAGGHVRLLDGSPYRAGAPAQGLLAAPDEPSWLAVREAFFGEASSRS
jgi:fructose-1,6-bisphosphatase/inositol monophosphatase family enzyme